MSIETLMTLARAAGHEPLPVLNRRGAWSGPGTIDQWPSLAGVFETIGAKTDSGEYVSESNALKYTTVFACVRILAETEAQLPLHVYRSIDGGGKEIAPGHWAYARLHDAPNEEMSSYLFRLYMRQNRALWGNAYALIEWDNAGRLRALWPLRPDWMTIYRAKSGRKVYEYNPPDGIRAGRYPESDILHFRGLGDDLVGYSPIRLAREAIGLGKAAEKFGATFFKNGAVTSGVLTFPGKLGDPAGAQKAFNEAHQGAAQAHKVLLIDNGAKFTTTTIPPNDAQFLETRSFQRTEVYAMYGVPPHMAGDPEKSTSWGTGIEQQSIGYVTYTVMPSLVCEEQEYNRKLLGGGYFAKHAVAGLMRGDAASRAAFYSVMVDKGIMTRNEVRELEELNRMQGGDDLTVQAQMIPIQKMGQTPEPPATGGPNAA